MDARLRYTAPAIGFHWLIAILVVSGWCLGVYMDGLKLSPEKLRIVSYHKWIGITVLGLACLRAAWRVTHAPPPPNPAHPAWQRRAAAFVHHALYVLMFAVPLAGWLFSSAAGYPVKYLGVIPLPDLVAKDKALAGVLQQVHVILAFVLSGVVAIHVGAALQHFWFHRDDTLSRMLPFVRPRSPR
ncbi:MAG TPA: cytochrome b [Nevskiaceae bacterium]|nr:cytochrome b [Nevskiaceae bacterium]